ncbi:hypothetical protein [Fructobacillus evanidus]|uniref:Uncharacterized protein n=1 Tax=Fructobacillus evanidus TaxID=3064281 RepID=A0ABN9YY29_9LACO|nr:unnamed protein product [Fructobacillus sp. LMG 32999]CAK1247583.1 unnamed protein product [Fructobacillus sp. LMG 32999]CAK1248406.1 unnamed protein product [Fructobacillus sp. LMG 32999]CAK1248772.1 unnamed protein product [Fructobacillus sp. LMG 32999]CAK1254139.1 unnamed protein product [Fructobacillus sp. LMG 32999]
MTNSSEFLNIEEVEPVESLSNARDFVEGFGTGIAIGMFFFM